MKKFSAQERKIFHNKIIELKYDGSHLTYSILIGDYCLWSKKYPLDFLPDTVADDITNNAKIDEPIPPKILLELYLLAKEKFDRELSSHSETIAVEDTTKPIKIVRKASLPDIEVAETGGKLIEEIYDPENGARYAIYDLDTANITYKKYFEIKGIRYEPIDNDDIEKGQVLLPSKAEEYGTTEILTNEVRNFLNYWHEETDQKNRKIDIYYAFASYIKELLPIIPYRRRLSGFGTGKSAWLETIGSICYRPLFLVGCDTQASMRRTFDLWRGTAIIDEADFDRSDLFSTIIKILNIGFDSKMGWYRCCNEKDPSQMILSYVYGPKLLATRREFRDIALESRCLSSTGKENRTLKPLFRNDRFRQQALNLRNKLLMWRFRNWKTIKEDVNILEDPDVMKKILGEDLPVLSRIKQTLIPIIIPMISVSHVEKYDLTSEFKELMLELNEKIVQKDPDIQLEYELNRVLPGILTGKEIRKDPISGGAWVKIRDLSTSILEESDIPDSRQKEIDTRHLCKEIANLLRRKGLKVKAGSGNLKVVWFTKEILESKAIPTTYETVSKVSKVSKVSPLAIAPANSIMEVVCKPYAIIPYDSRLTSLTTLTPDKVKTPIIHKSSNENSCVYELTHYFR